MGFSDGSAFGGGTSRRHEGRGIFCEIPTPFAAHGRATQPTLPFSGRL